MQTCGTLVAGQSVLGSGVAPAMAGPFGSCGLLSARAVVGACTLLNLFYVPGLAY